MLNDLAVLIGFSLLILGIVFSLTVLMFDTVDGIWDDVEDSTE